MLDTNLISETRKRKADPRILQFFRSASRSTLYLSVLTLGELRKGVAMKRRTKPEAAAGYSEWINELEAIYADRIVSVDIATARLWGEFSAARTRPLIDTMLAATAIVHDLTLVTRNVGDIHDLPVRVLNPWSEAMDENSALRQQ